MKDNAVYLRHILECIAATPEAVPVRDWQKEELARRKANLMKNPASGLTWEEFKHRGRHRNGR